MNREPVSVVIPYSSEHTTEAMLDEAKRSVRAQSIPTELIVIADTERGPAAARNVGLERADTRYVAFLDADDRWYEGKLDRQLDRMESAGAGLCVEGEPMSTHDFIYEVFVGSVDEITSSIVVDTDRIGTRFEESLTAGWEDHLFVLEAASEAGVCLCQHLTFHREHDRSMTAQYRETEAHRVEGKRYAEFVAERVPEARPYLYIYYRQLYAMLGLYAHRDRDFRSAATYFRQSLQIGFHPYTVLYLLRSALLSIASGDG